MCNIAGVSSNIGSEMLVALGDFNANHGQVVKLQFHSHGSKQELGESKTAWLDSNGNEHRRAKGKEQSNLNSSWSHCSKENEFRHKVLNDKNLNSSWSHFRCSFMVWVIGLHWQN